MILVITLLAPISESRIPHSSVPNASEIDLESGGRVEDPPLAEGSELFRSFFLSSGVTRRRSGTSPTPNATDFPANGSPALASDNDSTDRLSQQAEVTSFLRAKRAFATVDLLCTVYRSMLPVPLWLSYFSNGPGSDVIPMTYLFIKVFNLSSLIRAIVEVIRNSLAGRTVSLLPPVPAAPLPVPAAPLPASHLPSITGIRKLRHPSGHSTNGL
jgi:hypothetical protein